MWTFVCKLHPASGRELRDLQSAYAVICSLVARFAKENYQGVTAQRYWQKTRECLYDEKEMLMRVADMAWSPRNVFY